MREFFKVLCALIAVAGFGTSLVVWLTQWPNGAPLHLHLVAPLALFVGGLGFGWIHFQRDDAPDFLRQQFGNYYNRDGLCFVFIVKAESWVAYLDTYFQNQYDRPCVATIELRPALGLLPGRPAMPTISLHFECPPAGFGVSCIPITIPPELRGRRQPFEVGTTVVYPEGRGRRMRFRDGIALLTAAGSFQDGILDYVITGSKVSTVTLDLPMDCQDLTPGDSDLQTTVLWTLQGA